MLQLAPPTRGSLNAAASRATAVGSNTVSASTVRSRSPLANRAAAFIAALRPQRVPWQMTMSTRPSARARSATARVSSVEPSSTTMISNGRKVCWLQRRDRGTEPGAAVESRYDHADRSVARRHSVASSPRAEQSQRKQRQRSSEECRISAPRKRAGRNWFRRAAAPLQTCDPPLRRTRCSPNANAAERVKGGELPSKLYIAPAQAANPHST